jgi:hypothetical protein
MMALVRRLENTQPVHVHELVLFANSVCSKLNLLFDVLGDHSVCTFSLQLFHGEVFISSSSNWEYADALAVAKKKETASKRAADAHARQQAPQVAKNTNFLYT